MAWDLSSNWRLELARLRFANKIGRERATELLPPYPGDAVHVGSSGTFSITVNAQAPTAINAVSGSGAFSGWRLALPSGLVAVIIATGALLLIGAGAAIGAALVL